MISAIGEIWAVANTTDMARHGVISVSLQVHLAPVAVVDLVPGQCPGVVSAHAELVRVFIYGSLKH